MRGILFAACLAVAGAGVGEEKPAAEPIGIPLGAPPVLDGRVEESEWEDALQGVATRSGGKGPSATVRLKHDGVRLYVACDSPFPCSGEESAYLLFDAEDAGASMPGADDLQMNFSPFDLSRMPWTESRGDGRTWIPSGAPTGWTAFASAATPDHVQMEFAISLRKIGLVEGRPFRLGVLVDGGLGLPPELNLYTPSSWWGLRLKGIVAGSVSPPEPGDRLAKAQRAREAYSAAEARLQELRKLGNEPPKTRAEAVSRSQGLDAAAKAYAAAVEAEPDNPLLRYAHGNFRFMSGDLDAAVAEFEAASRLAPHVPTFDQRRYGVYLRVHALSKALATAEAELSCHGETMSGLLLRGQVRLFLQDLEGAFDDLTKLSGMTLDAKMGRHVDSLLASVRSLRAAWPAEADARKRDEAKGDLPRAEIVTERGRIVVELFEDDAPNTVANFVSLAESGFFDGMRFLLGEFMVCAGDPRSRDPENPRVPDGPGYRIRTQISSRGHWRGTVVMANGGKDTDGSQFVVNLRPNPEMNGEWAVFARVLEGQDVADQIKPGDLITSVRILRKRAHPYVPEKLEGPPPAPRP